MTKTYPSCYGEPSVSTDWGLRIEGARRDPELQSRLRVMDIDEVGELENTALPHRFVLKTSPPFCPSAISFYHIARSPYQGLGEL